VTSAEQMSDVLGPHRRARVRQHRTTLVFVNTRRLAERLAHLLGSGWATTCGAHHGSFRRIAATGSRPGCGPGSSRRWSLPPSLELGIDIARSSWWPDRFAAQHRDVPAAGRPVEPQPGRTPRRGVCIPHSRRRAGGGARRCLVAVRAGRLDRHPRRPELPLDIFGPKQPVVAETATTEWRTDDLFDLVRRAAPYVALTGRSSTRSSTWSANGIPTGRGRRGAYVHPRPGETRGPGAQGGPAWPRWTSGGAIPEIGDYRVVITAARRTRSCGTVNEDWAVESMAGDIFFARHAAPGRIRRIEAGVVRVRDAAGAPPTVRSGPVSAGPHRRAVPRRSRAAVHGRRVPDPRRP